MIEGINLEAHNERPILLTTDKFPEPVRDVLKKGQRIDLVPVKEGVRVFRVRREELKD